MADQLAVVLGLALQGVGMLHLGHAGTLQGLGFGTAPGAFAGGSIGQFADFEFVFGDVIHGLPRLGSALQHISVMIDW